MHITTVPLNYEQLDSIHYEEFVIIANIGNVVKKVPPKAVNLKSPVDFGNKTFTDSSKGPDNVHGKDCFLTTC